MSAKPLKREGKYARTARIDAAIKAAGSLDAVLQRARERAHEERVRRARVRKESLVYRRPDGEVVVFRSLWELDFAKYMDAIGCQWVYEPTRCRVDDSWYTPDFLVSCNGRVCFVELHAMTGFSERYGESADKRNSAATMAEELLGAPLYILDEGSVKLVRKRLRELTA